MRTDRSHPGFRFAAFVAFVVGAAVCSNCIAGAPQTGNDRDAAAIQLLARHFVEAVNHRSESEMKTILHPKSRACMRTQNAPYFDGIFSRRMNFVIPSDYVFHAESRSPEYFSPPEAEAAYPVGPTHTLQIEFHIGPLSSTTIQLSIIKQGSAWYEVLRCPTAEDMKRMQATEAESAAYNQRVQQILANLAEPLRSELEALVRSGQRDAAVRKYREAYGEEVAIAFSVIEKLVSKN
jgi:hypothetical protein